MIRALIRVVYLSIPIFYYFIKKIKPSMQFPTKKYHDVCIEAYPSSANSFFYVLMKNIFPNLKIAHHTHAIASLKIAIKYNIPIFVVIRNPLDAIASRISRFDDKIEACLLEYIIFYNFVLNNINKIKVFSFEDITKKIYNIMFYISKDLNLDFNYSPDEFNYQIEIAFKEINDHYTKKGRNEAAAIPKIERETKKEEIKRNIKKHYLYKKAVMVYEQVNNMRVILHEE